MLLTLIIVLALSSFSCVDCLTCLQCTDIESPRHCKHVTECPSGKVCYIQKTTSRYGEVLFDLGCTDTATCSNRSHGNHTCGVCCSSDLCNAAGCGQQGFPSSRGPICYSCSAQTTEGSCPRIDFCNSNEVCMLREQREFDDTVYTSQCAMLTHCEDLKLDVAPIIGRSILEDTRSLTETTCHKCCHGDLCNAFCRTKVDYCTSSQCVHGRCVNGITGYTCVCDPTYNGKNCSEVNYCATNPCVHGKCVNGLTGYTCVCDPMYNGNNCSEINYCAPYPCDHGTCVNGRTNYTCVCDPSYTGRNCTEGNYCAPNPCEHGTCVNGRTNYTCVCDPSHTGRTCTDMNYCAQNHCEHGTCVNGRTNYTCVCDPSHTGRNCTEVTGEDCLELRTHTHVSGVYRVRPAGMIQDIEVYCDLATDGGGWTVFQRRTNGSSDFYQNFSSYENGFGNVHGEHWLGLKYINAMTSLVQTELRIDMSAADGSMAYEVFPNFRISAAPYYTLNVDKGHGTAGDTQGFSYTNGSAFLTHDHDNSIKCADQYHGGWWYSNCAYANINGEYVTPGTVNFNRISTAAGVTYRDFKGVLSLQDTTMMFRRV